MEKYLEAVLHQDVDILPFTETGKLPLAYRNRYRLSEMSIAGQGAVLVEPVEQEPLAAIKKQHRQLEIYTGSRCVLALRNMSSYARDAMVKEGIPFVWEGHQVYLPFLGMLLDSTKGRTVPQCEKISFLTQRMLLTALYQSWEEVTVTKAAGMLWVTKTAVSHSFDELEAINIPYLSVKSRARKLTIPKDKQVVWETMKDSLRNPVIATYALKECPAASLLTAGLTALAEYSLLSEPACPAFAVSKKAISSLKLTKSKLALAEKTPACIVQEIGYQIDFGPGTAIDPLSLVLSLNKEETEDPRISMAVDEMLERYVW
ncbi:hypothetical protein [Selenomonas sp. KH1T6]|uniref:hypothetical protein n=1 Tax=Selenomonas sp. KH1T6 TaxID=3158784 RepID=UPI0008A75F6C|nr:hypothetical protein SAMN05216583_13027 [Selenomonas ruminantium]